MPTPERYQPEVTQWFTSTRTNNGNQCVEVRFDGPAVLIRDSKYRRDPANRPEREPVIIVDAGVWMEFLRTVDDIGGSAHVRTRPDRAGGTVLWHGDTELRFTAGEWWAFVAGVRDGEFDRIPVATG
ncbi:DUF397 domain-containing protein [Nocardia spumae]|uniref:DUF397 domain-containing protein n=1 Tax=Nocardia spumae TaxID=2887190 RepID=UPI001D159A05|nr:DUF397 domain-containing protein [Nocardia spumae]